MALDDAARARLEVVAPLLGRKLELMASAIEARRDSGLTAALTLIRSDRNNALMTSIDAEMAHEAGLFRYLTKPIEVNAFMETLDVALQSAEASRAARKETER
jgi:hypothetical protein